MAMKELFRKMEPMPLYIILALTVAFFVTELILSHVTHALTLLMDSYHMLCNIIALTGCIITIKYGKDTEKDDFQPLKQSDSIESSVGEELTKAQNKQEKKLKNTFGWARIDVIFMLICCVFLASLSFSIFVEALQTLAHIDHHDEMHYPIAVFCIGGAGLLLNAICYLLIGGYTFHQGSFLYVTESGDVVLNKIVVNESLQQGGRRLSRTKSIHSTILPPKKREGLWEMTRDINGCILVIICALFIYFTDKNLAKFIDPIISMVSATFMMILSYPYMRESCLILLQTMPDSINIDSLKADLLQHFPDVVDVHDFHVWQLTASKVITTVHMIFQNPKVYSKIKEEVKEFFADRGITHVTIQPEFFKKNDSTESLISNKFGPNCLMACQNEVCRQNHCCPNYEEKKLFKSTSKEVLSGNQTPDLKSVRTVVDEQALATYSISSSSISSAKNTDEEERNEINKSLNQIQEEQDLKANKFIDENEAKIDDKIDRVLRRDNEVICKSSESTNNEETRLNVNVIEENLTSTDCDEKV